MIFKKKPQKAELKPLDADTKYITDKAEVEALRQKLEEKDTGVKKKVDDVLKELDQFNKECDEESASDGAV